MAKNSHFIAIARSRSMPEGLRATLRVSQLRGIEGRDVEPSAGVIDSQTVKKTEKGGA